MKNDKEHLKIDLDFLDKKETSHVTTPKAPPPSSTTSNTLPPTKPTSTPVSTGYKYNWKNILIIGGIVLFFGWAIFSGDSDSSSSSTTYTPSELGSNNLLAEGGQTFRCSDSDYDRAVQLRPSASLGAQLANESDTLDAQIASNKEEGAAIEGMYVDEYDEYSVDNYNYRVNSYNAERQRLINAVNSWQSRSDAFDRSIDTYNNFLDANCTPQ